MIAIVSPSIVVDRLLPYADLLVPAFVAGFFLVTLVALAYGENRYVRRTYVGGFMSVLILTNVLMPVTPAPVIQWHKFSELRPAEQTRYEIRVVDGSGNEIRYDDKATWKVDGMSMRIVRDEMLEADAEKRRAIARHLFDEAREHRAYLRDRSPVHALRFPPHATANTWTASELESYDRFVGIRVYRLEIETSADGTEIVDTSEELVYEYEPNEAAGVANASAVAPSSTVRPGTAAPVSGRWLST
jgi:hypothetical protein